MTSDALLTVCVIVVSVLAGAARTSKLRFAKDSVSLEQGDTVYIRISATTPLEEPIRLTFLYQMGKKILSYQEDEVIEEVHSIVLTPANKEADVQIIGHDAGRVLLHVVANSSTIEETDLLLIEVNVFNSLVLDVMRKLAGIIYLIAWSIKQIPQTYINWKNKSVEGMSFDYVAYNTLGMLTYAAYNILLYWVEYIKNLYIERHPFGVFPVGLNDVICSLVMLVISLVQCVQCKLYESGGQHFSKAGTVLFVGTLIFVIVMAVLASAGFIIWLDFITAVSFVKVASTPLKYTPQIWYHYKRKTTQGWSNYYTWMDFVGGLGSVVEMILAADNKDDWGSLFGNLPKFSLGILHLIFDSIILTQTYILYRNDRPYDSMEMTSEENSYKPKKDLPNEKTTILDKSSSVQDSSKGKESQ